ncbi:MAG: SDR family oxidoreductase [Candidatus Hermodarchaeota archaeon]
MKGKICLVTGGTSGIGRVTAETLAEFGATVVITGRNQEAGNEIINQMRDKTDNTSHKLLITDFASLEKVRELATSFKEEFDRLDVLINNAGVSLPTRWVTDDGLEATFAINHFAPFLLTNLLLDLVKKSAPARIINVSSAMHKNAPLNLDDINSEKSYRWMQVYGSSKLANVLFTYELAERLEGTSVTVNAVHPGFVRTNLNRSYSKIVRGTMRLMPFAISPKEGAATSIYLASSPEVEGVTGRYFVKKKATESSSLSYDKDLRKKLWDLSIEITGLKT